MQAVPAIRHVQSRGGARIAFYAVGQGIPAVLAPSPSTHIQREWQSPLLRGASVRLAEHYRLVRYDRRGAGLSDRRVSDYSLEARQADLTAVADRLRLARFVLIAQATSVAEAVAYAVNRPDRVARMILLNAATRSADRDASPRFRAYRQTVAADWETASLTLASLLGDWGDADQIRRHAAVIRDAVEPDELDRFHAALADEDIGPLLERLTMPVLILHPARHAFVPVEAANDLASRVPDSQLRVIDAPAAALLGDGGAAVEAIREFLAGLREARQTEAGAQAPGESLSPRELDVLRLLALGLENAEIAERLFITANTVARHVNHIYAKTGATNRVQATRYAIERGLTE